MGCTDHDRAHCPEPRCHVLAVCAAEIPSPMDAPVTEVSPGRRWAQSCGYLEPWQRIDVAAEQIAARLVAWMRWRGERRAGQLQQLSVTCDPPWPPRADEDADWQEFGPGYHHPLDAIMPHAARVTALASKCPNRTCHGPHGQRHHVAIMATGAVVPSVCDHDGINWTAVAILLDRMTEIGLSLDVVHEWRPPSDDRPATLPTSGTLGSSYFGR